MTTKITNSPIKRFALQTYGCQMNVADSELVEGILTNLGLEKTSNYDEADAIFLNTCAIRENAETKVHSKLGNLHKIKLNKPHLIIGVLGCMAQNLKDDLLKKAGSDDSYETKAIKMNKEKAIKKKPKKLKNVFAIL